MKNSASTVATKLVTCEYQGQPATESGRVWVLRGLERYLKPNP